MKKIILPILGAGGLLAVALAIVNARRHLAVIGSVALLAAQTNAPAQLINGAGSTLITRPSPNGLKPTARWIRRFTSITSPSAPAADSSNCSRRRWTFGASDAPMSDDNMAKAPAKSCTFPSWPAAWR